MLTSALVQHSVESELFARIARQTEHQVLVVDALDDSLVGPAELMLEQGPASHSDFDPLTAG